MHIGANNYYRVYVTNFAKGEQVSGITLKDDMTSSLFAGIMDLNAPQAVTVPWGISFYDDQNQHLPAQDIIWSKVDGSTVGGVAQPNLEYVGDTTFNPEFPNASTGFSEGQPFNGTWTLEIPEFALPAEASYAIVGYAIKIGQVADPINSNGSEPFLKTNGSPAPAAPNSFWVNTAAASKGTFPNNQEMEPNRCRISDLDNDIMFTGWDENKSDYANFSDCKTYHTLEENFFHLWKQGTDVVGAQNPQGNNLQESHFVLADSKTEAETESHLNGSAGQITEWSQQDRAVHLLIQTLRFKRQGRALVIQLGNMIRVNLVEFMTQ